MNLLGTYWYPFRGLVMVVPFASVVFAFDVTGHRPWVRATALSKMTPPSPPASARTMTWFDWKSVFVFAMPWM